MFIKLLKQISIRKAVQIMFATVVLYIGITFILFVGQVENESLSNFSRPAGVEAFLPISALVGLKAWLVTGNFDPIHPAGLVIFLSAIAVSLLLKRTFCSWICPIGTLSEGLAKIGVRVFGGNFKIYRWLDYLLRSVKYILLSIFVGMIFFGMSGADAWAFIHTPYNMVSDVKMLRFFLDLSIYGITVIGVLGLLSILYENFWCRYLCPYGALLGLFSMLSPFKITRDQTSCIHCGKCTKSCSNQILVEHTKRVWSPECTGCLNCVQECPVNGTLTFKVAKSRRSFSPLNLAVGVVGLWILFIVIAKATGHWETQMTLEMYRGILTVIE